MGGCDRTGDIWRKKGSDTTILEDAVSAKMTVATCFYAGFYAGR